MEKQKAARLASVRTVLGYVTLGCALIFAFILMTGGNVGPVSHTVRMTIFAGSGLMAMTLYYAVRPMIDRRLSRLEWLIGTTGQYVMVGLQDDPRPDLAKTRPLYLVWLSEDEDVDPIGTRDARVDAGRWTVQVFKNGLGGHRIESI